MPVANRRSGDISGSVKSVDWLRVFVALCEIFPEFILRLKSQSPFCPESFRGR